MKPALPPLSTRTFEWVRFLEVEELEPILPRWSRLMLLMVIVWGASMAVKL